MWHNTPRESGTVLAKVATEAANHLAWQTENYLVISYAFVLYSLAFGVNAFSLFSWQKKVLSER